MITGDETAVRQAMEHAIGAEGVTDDVARHSIDGLLPKTVVFPRDIQELSRVTAAAMCSDLAVAPWGGGTRVELGNTIERLDVVINVSGLDRLILHNPADLTCTVDAGITVSRLQQALAQHGQFVALDPPLPDQATIGGTLASGATGPLKWQFWNPRDLVIGMKVVQADGIVTKSGGQVVKNVSGYDMARLHIGGLGTLGVIAEVSFKLTPMPQDQATVVAAFDTARHSQQAGLDIFHSDTVPLALTSFDGGVNRRAEIVDIDGSHFLAVRIGGRPLTVERQVKDCTALCRQQGAATVETVDEADLPIIWRRLADFGWDEKTTPVMAARATLVPNNVPELAERLESSSAARGLRTCLISHPGYGTTQINWFAENDEVSSDSVRDALRHARDAVHSAGGHMVIERCPSEVKPEFDVWGDLGEPLSIMRRMKEQYDPRGILNPGRFAGGI